MDTNKQPPEQPADQPTQAKKPRKARKPRRRGKGSVFRRPDRKGGKEWIAQIPLEEGGTKQRYFYTQEEAEEALNEMLYEQRHGTLITAKNQTVRDYLESWLENVQKPAVRINHYLNTRAILRNHILPELGHIQLQQLNEMQVQALYTRLGETHAAKTVHNIHGVLHKALSQAVTWRLVSRNVCDGVVLPRQKRHEHKSLTLEEARKLLEVARGHRLEVMLILALTTGMRLGELLGLHWQDIDFGQGKLQIRRSASRVHGQGYREFETKTERSRRMLTLHKYVLDMLRQHRLDQQEKKLAALATGAEWQDRDLVFCNIYGSFLRPDRVREHFHKLLAKAGLPHMRFHDLRHSAATILMSKNVPAKVVQEILGHSTISMTLDIYSHVLPGMQEAAAEKWNDLFENGENEGGDGG